MSPMAALDFVKKKKNPSVSVFLGLKYVPWLCCHGVITTWDRFVNTNGMGRYIDDKDSLIAKFEYGKKKHKQA